MASDKHYLEKILNRLSEQKNTQSKCHNKVKKQVNTVNCLKPKSIVNSVKFSIPEGQINSRLFNFSKFNLFRRFFVHFNLNRSGGVTVKETFTGGGKTLRLG